MSEQDAGDVLVKTGLVDIDRRTSKFSLSIDSFGPLKLFWATTGIIEVSNTFDLYLTGNREVGGAGLYEKTPIVVVYTDEAAEAGGFARGQGPLGPAAAYSAGNHGDFKVQWHPGAKRFFVQVENTSTSDRDYVVLAIGV